MLVQELVNFSSLRQARPGDQALRRPLSQRGVSLVMYTSVSDAATPRACYIWYQNQAAYIPPQSPLEPLDSALRGEGRSRIRYLIEEFIPHQQQVLLVERH